MPLPPPHPLPPICLGIEMRYMLIQYMLCSQEAGTLAGEDSQAFHTLRTAVLSTDTTCAMASELCTSTAPKETSVSSKEYAVIRPCQTHFYAICVVLLR